MEEALLLLIFSLSEQFDLPLALALVILVANFFVFMSSFFCSRCDSSTTSSSSDLETESYISCKSGFFLRILLHYSFCCLMYAILVSVVSLVSIVFYLVRSLLCMYRLGLFSFYSCSDSGSCMILQYDRLYLLL